MMPERRECIPIVARSMVEHRVHREFPDALPAAILLILDRYGAEPHERERERTQMAILKMSVGRQGLLERCVELAKTDFRDALAAAEYPHSMGADAHGRGTEATRLAQIEDERQYRDWLGADAVSG